MDDLIELNSLKVGQQVKLQGIYDAENRFTALEVISRNIGDDDVVVGIIRDVNSQNHSLKIMNQDFRINGTSDIRDFNQNPVGFESLEKNMIVVLKGKYIPVEGFAAQQVKMKRTRDFNIEKLKGKIEAINPQERTMRVNGVPVVVSKRAMILAS